MVIEMKEDRLTVRLDRDVMRQLDEIANGNGQSRSDLVRQLVVEHCERQRREESFHDAFKDCIGIFDGPPDLSTNPKHMEGFGRAKAHSG